MPYFLRFNPDRDGPEGDRVVLTVPLSMSQVTMLHDYAGMLPQHLYDGDTPDSFSASRFGLATCLEYEPPSKSEGLPLGELLASRAETLSALREERDNLDIQLGLASAREVDLVNAARRVRDLAATLFSDTQLRDGENSFGNVTLPPEIAELDRLIETQASKGDK